MYLKCTDSKEPKCENLKNVEKEGTFYSILRLICDGYLKNVHTFDFFFNHFLCRIVYLACVMYRVAELRAKYSCEKTSWSLCGTISRRSCRTTIWKILCNYEPKTPDEKRAQAIVELQVEAPSEQQCNNSCGRMSRSPCERLLEKITNNTHMTIILQNIDL